MKRSVNDVANNVINWSVDEVCNWLRTFGFSEFVDGFSRMMVSGDFLVQLFNMEEQVLSGELFNNKIIWTRKFKLEGNKLMNAIVSSVSTSSFSSCCESSSSKSKPSLQKTQSISSYSSSSSSNNNESSSFIHHLEPVVLTPREMIIVKREDVQNFNAGGGGTTSSSISSDDKCNTLTLTDVSQFPPSAPLQLVVTSPRVESPVIPIAQGNVTNLAAHLSESATTTSKSTRSRKSSSSVVSSASDSPEIERRKQPRRSSSSSSSITNSESASPAIIENDPRGPPIMLTRSMLECEPFDWYWIDNKGSQIYLQTFWYITKKDPNGEKYTSTKALLEATAKGEMVMNEDYFADETGALDKAIEMYKDTHNYFRNMKSNHT